MEIIWNFFSDLIGHSSPRHAKLKFHDLDISTLDLHELDAPLLESEVLAAIHDLAPDKAPDPDGYTGLFFRRFWPIIKHDVMAAVNQFYALACNNLGIVNDATMVLIPKKPDATAPKDFRPLCLISSFAKLILKVLARRLQPRMPELVRPCQSAFIKGRTIHDNFAYVQGLVKSLQHKKCPSLFLKMDIEKAFDSVSWEFLLEVLEARGFGRKFRNLISCLLFSSSTRILVNGTLSEPIFHRRGLGKEIQCLPYYLLM